MNRLMNLVTKYNGLIRSFSIQSRFYATKLDETRLKGCIYMSQDTKHVICYHPEHDNAHPFELSKPMERKIEDANEVLKADVLNVYKKRFDSKVPKNNKEWWFDTLKLSKMFYESPMKFKIPNRKERIRTYLKSKIHKNRESI